MKLLNRELLKYYDKPMAIKLPWWGGLVDKFMKNFSREEVAASFNYRGVSCLDVACGDGDLLNHYLKRQYNRLVGVDTAIKEIARARNGADKKTTYIISDLDTFLDKLIEKKAYFNDIYMLAILEHVGWPQDIVDKASKVLGNGGRVIVEVPNVAWLPYRLGLLLGKFPETAPTKGVISGVYDEHIRFYTLKTLDKIFYRAGFRREKTSCSGRLRKLKLLWPSLLASDFVVAYKKR